MKEIFNISPEEIENGKVMGGIAYLGFIGLIIAFVTSHSNKYVLYHCQQSLLLTIISFTYPFLSGFKMLPFIGDVIGILITIIGIAVFILFLIGLINGFTGKIQPIPIIGEYALKFNILKYAKDFEKAAENVANNSKQNQGNSDTGKTKTPDDKDYSQPSLEALTPKKSDIKRRSSKDQYGYGDEFRKRDDF